MRARSWRRCGIGCASSGRGCAARSSRTCAAGTRRSTCSSRSSPIATAATCSSSAASIGRAIPGIVHGSSGSGASLFLEPLSTVEINNDIVALEQQEAEEVRRILLALADALRRRAADLQRTVDAATELDVLQARARFSLLVDGIQPAIAGDGRLELRAARHPLLHSRGAAPSRRRDAAGAAPTATPRPPSSRSTCS